jgi:hypothetical protein
MGYSLIVLKQYFIIIIIIINNVDFYVNLNNLNASD